MISKLSEVQDNYSVTDKTHGAVKFGPKEFKLSTGNVAYVMLNAAGDAVKGLTDPHITIWGKNARTDSWIASVEFSWAGARHVYFNPKSGTFNTPNIPTSDQGIAKTLELLLVATRLRDRNSRPTHRDKAAMNGAQAYLFAKLRLAGGSLDR